jgi:hypothetical protein
MALPALVFAQGAGFGAISGVVEDSSGAVVPGAHVTLDNPSKGIHRETDTTSSGNFTFQSLVPASDYTVKVTKASFSDYVVKSITVEVGSSVDIRAALQVRTAGTEVEVTGVAPTVDFSKSDTSFVVGSKQLLELPINGRRVDAFVALSPGVSNDGAFGLLSFRGNPGGNNFTTDGVDTTNSYYGENAGRTRTYNISQDAVQEFQVVTSNYAAEFGKAAGGVVNTVTRSGSNSFHGSAYEFFRNRTLNATDRTTVNGLAPNGINPPEWRHQAGLSVGGPIKKDKLFFFFNGELFRRNAPIVSSNIGAGAGNNVFDGSGNVLPGNTNGTNTLAKTHQTCVPGGLLKLPSNVPNIPGPTQAQCDAAVAYVTSRVIPQLIPRHMDNNLAFGKIDWHPTDKDAVSFSGNYLDFRSPNGIQTQLSLTNGNAIGNNADTNVFDRTGRASWTRIISSRAINEFRFGLFKDRQIDPASTSLIPDFGGTSAPAALTVNSVSNLGYATNYPRVNPSELRYEFSDNFSWTKAKHTLKFGGTLSHLEDFVQSMANQYPTYTYSPLANAQTNVTFNGQTNQTITASALTYLAVDFGGGTTPGNQAYSSYSQTTGNRQVDFAFWETSLFAQDEWHITSKFMITPGIRYEHSGVPQPTVCNPNFPGTCHIPDDHNNSIAPRLGFSYALDSKTVLRGGYGMFFNRYITSSIENLIVSNGLYQNAYSYSISSLTASALTCLPTFPQVNPFDWAPSGACAKTLSPGILYADNNYRPSYSQQANIALEHEIARNVSLSMSYVWSRSLHLPVSYDTNVLDPTTSLTYHVLDAAGAVDPSLTFTMPIYTAFNPAYTFNGVQYKGRVSVLQSAANSYYNAALMTLRYRGSKWFQGDLNYTWGHTIDWGVGAAPTFGSTTPSSFYNADYRDEKGSSTLDRRHVVVVNYVVAPKLMDGNNAFAKYVANGWQVAGVTTFASSQPAAPTISGTFSGGGISNFSINGLGGSSRVPFESTSLVNIGAAYRTDARLSKVIPITERVKVNLGFEAFNIFNHLIPTGRDTAQYTVSVAGGFGVLTPRPQFKSLSLTQVTPDGTTARRAQAVIRINF